MTRVMMKCYAPGAGGQELYTGLDVPEIPGALRGHASRSVQCPHCGQIHPLRRLYFEGNDPPYRLNWKVALECQREFAAEVGIIISCSAMLERLLPSLFARLTGQIEEDAATTMGTFSAIGSRIGLLKSIAVSKPRPSRIAEAIEIFSQKMEWAVKTRNNYAHAEYGLGAQGRVEITSWLHDARRPTRTVIKSLDEAAEDVKNFEYIILEIEEFLYQDIMPVRWAGVIPPEFP